MPDEIKKLTIPSMLGNSFNKYPGRPALSFIDGNPLTYSEIKEKITRVIGILYKYGISKGDKVAILGENHPNWGISFFAVTSIGAVAVPIMHEFTSVEVENILQHSEAKAIFISPKIVAKIDNNDNLKELIVKISLEDFTETLLNGKENEAVSPGKLTDTKTSLNEITGIFDKTNIEEDDLASIVYTSGTTGHSKGVMLTHKNMVSDAAATDNVVTVVPEDKLLSVLPLSHTIECTLGLLIPIMKGASIYYLEKPPAAANLLPALEKVKPTIMLSVPLIIEKIYRTKIISKIQSSKVLKAAYMIPALRKRINIKAGKKLIETFGGNLRMFCIGGAPLAEDVEKFLRESQFPYTVGYGLTETSPLLTGSLPSDFKFRSTGKILKSVEMIIDNPDPQTGTGEILVKGSNIMKGYYKNPEKTEEVFTNDGWLRTGDLGYIDKDGYLFIKGRIKNVIIGANGKNIYPEELESLINECEYVVESLVVKSDNRLIAKVHLDYNKLENIYPQLKSIESEIKREIHSILENIRSTVNKKVASFSKIARIDEQPAPFEKTPTRKIKRYLYK